jgi:hypothetical protein
VRRFPLALLLLAANALGAAPLAKITGPSRVPADPQTKLASFLLMGIDSVSDKPLAWQYLNVKTRKFPTFTGDDGRKGVMLAATEMPLGVHKFAIVASGRPDGAPADSDLAFDFFILEVEVYDPTPTPPPAPPAVDPVVDPVVPPTPSPPAPAGNLRAVVLYESTQAMTRPQFGALYSKTGIYAYLNAHCLKDTAGNPSWRAWDKDVDVTNEAAEWQDAMKQAKADLSPLPKIVLFSGNTKVGSKAITTEADALAYLKSIGGN